MNFPKISDKKFNNWCERKALFCNDQSKINKAYQFFAKKDLTNSEACAYFLHELTDCDGFEFVVFSNSKLTESITLNEKMILVPCFKVENGMNMRDPIARQSIEMEKRGRFVYDGWVPIQNWSLDEVRKTLHEIDRNLSIFSLKVETYFDWKPKYGSNKGSMIFPFNKEHLNDLRLISSKLEKLPIDDIIAIYKSFGWLSQAFRLNDPIAKFLFLILSIESLATYIETKSTINSSLYKFRVSKEITKTERRDETILCLEPYLKDWKSNPYESVRNAYQECIETGSTRLIKNHMSNLFGTESEVFELLFGKINDAESLYSSIRHNIAHGTTNIINEVDRQKIEKRINDITKIARSYLQRITKDVLEISSFQDTFTVNMPISMMDAIGGGAARYVGPTHMALIYN